MIKIVLLAPYADIKQEMEEALEEYTPPEPIQASVYTMNAKEVAGATFHADVIIARGFSSAILKRRMPGQLVVPLQISAYDVIDSVAAATSQFGSRNIALVGLPGTVTMADHTSRILDAKIVSYQVSDVGELGELIATARADGCDCFIGGLSLLQACQARGLDCVLLRTGKPAIIGSLEEAIRLVQSTREQREQSLSYKTILDCTKEGVVSLNEERRVTSINAFALRCLAPSGGDACIGLPAGQVIPFAGEELGAAFEKGKRSENEIHSHGGRMLAVDCIPMRRDREVVGCVVFLRSVDRLQNEESIIRQKMQAKGQKAKYRFSDIVCRSQAILHTIEKARIFAGVDSPVLIVGESGTGKELFAQSIHNESSRKDGPFIGVNCAALSETLLESELFGYSDGAFTGALKGGREGLFEAAHGGTLFLDEISEIPLSFQSKLLRVLQENEVRRLGSQRVTSVDVRIVAATNRDLNERVERNLFRQDLLFRLNVLYLHIQPLRRRPEDIMELFAIYTREYAAKYGKKLEVITSEAAALIEGYPWRGNVRELKNIAERLCVLSRGEIVDSTAFLDALYDEPPDGAGGEPAMPAERLNRDGDGERETLLRLLRQFDGNRGKVAEKLGLDRSTVWRKMKKHRLLEQRGKR